ncbi:hypothetical protein BC832DRAFT_435704 [Gaertneriomyces semiglobifer]|nr:hypothetical protein BC832DRAFT_435704 [Gaertneriomyces semiglobifer]
MRDDFIALSSDVVATTMYVPSSTADARDTMDTLVDVDSAQAGALGSAARKPVPYKARRITTQTLARRAVSEAKLDQLMTAPGLFADPVMDRENVVDAIVRQVNAELNNDRRAKTIIKELHARITSSGAVDYEDIMQVLLTEARRIQWERAEERAAGHHRAPNAFVTNNTIEQHRMRLQASMHDPIRDQAIIREMYDKVTPAGAADIDGMMEILVREGVQAAEQRRSRYGRRSSPLMAKL